MKEKKKLEAETVLSEEMMYDPICEDISDDEETDEESGQDVVEGEGRLLNREAKAHPGYDLVCEILRRCSYFCFTAIRISSVSDRHNDGRFPPFIQS